MLNPIESAIDHIVKAFYPKPIRFEMNGKGYIVEKLPAGWLWRNQDGEMQEDFGIEAFESAAEAQQSAIAFVESTIRGTV